MPIAQAEESHGSNNIREDHYSADDPEHLSAPNKIVAMSTKPAAVAPAVIAGNINYVYGTPVMIDPTVYVIWYGTWTNPCAATGDNSTPAIVNDFLKGVGVTPWYGINTRY